MVRLFELIRKTKALDIIGTYLTSSAVAPLNKEYVETESPLWYYCISYLLLWWLMSNSSYIYFGEDTRATRNDLPIYVGSVPTEHLHGFDEKLKASLERIVREGIDMDRMSMILSRDERQVNETLESATILLLMFYAIVAQQARICQGGHFLWHCYYRCFVRR